MISLVFIPIFFLIFALFIAVYVMIGVYVYRDAGKRGMNKVLWALVAVLVPSFLGIVIYLLVRNNSFSSSACPECHKPVLQDYSICPHCGYELMLNCNSCGKPVSKGWKLCPWCRQELPNTGDFSSSTVESSKSNKKLIAIIIAIVAVLFTLSIGLMIALPVMGYSNFQVLSYESNHGNGFSHQYKYFTGTKSEDIMLSKGQTAEVRVETVIEKGSLNVEIIDSNGEVIDTISSSGYKTLILKAEQEDKDYQIIVTGKKTRGRYKIDWNVSP
jgi:RNA polymerase subunit RPABC4/transcription elongation factor Spt4